MGFISRRHTGYLWNKKKKDILGVYKEFYKGSGFVKVFSGRIPQIKDVIDTNNCIVCPEYNSRTETLIILSVIDNRIKGGAGQAIQNMNVMLGLDEIAGFLH